MAALYMQREGGRGESICACCSAPKALFTTSLGQRPSSGNRKAKALKARLTPAPVQYIIDAVPQSLSKVIFHIIFTTKNREPSLDSNARPRMHAYLATVCRDLGAELVRVGGVADHVHIVTTLPRTVSQAQLIERIKKTSSKWIKALDRAIADFSGSADMGPFR